jgi:hypothetical protein
LRVIENAGGPKGLDLSGHDLSSIKLNPTAIAEELTGRDRDPPTIPWITAIQLGDPRMNLAEMVLDDAELTFAELEGTDLFRAQLRRANLGRAHLGNASLVWADLRDANLIAADLTGADVTRSKLEGAEFTHATLDGVTWFGAFLSHTRLIKQQLGRSLHDETMAKRSRTAGAFHDASQTYLLHKNNFLTLGRYEDAAWAYIKEQQMEKMALHWEWRSSFSKNWFSFLRWLRNWSFELLTGYGERAWMPAIWAIIVVLAFAVGYATAGNIAPDFAGDPETAQGSHNFVDALTHSIAAFATIGFNTLEPIGWGARLLTALESAFGIGLFALFIFTLGNRMSRS